MRTPKPPRWSDEQAVKALVDRLRDAEMEQEYQDAIDDARNVPLPVAAIPDPAAFARFKALARAARAKSPHHAPTAEEGEAVAEALRGRPEQFAHLVASGQCRAPAALRLAAEYVRGERNPRTGKLNRKPGRPKMTAVERRARNPIHDAAEEFPLIKQILKEFYGAEVTAREIHDRAEAIAQERAGTKSSLSYYLRRSSKSGHKI